MIKFSDKISDQLTPGFKEDLLKNTLLGKPVIAEMGINPLMTVTYKIEPINPESLSKIFTLKKVKDLVGKDFDIEEEKNVYKKQLALLTLSIQSLNVADLELVKPEDIYEYVYNATIVVVNPLFEGLEKFNEIIQMSVRGEDLANF
jgi:hypothetical protein